MHQHLGSHHRHVQRGAQLLVVMHLLLVKRLLQPDEIELLHDAADLDRLAQIVRADRVVDQREIGSDHGARLREQRDVGLAALVGVELVGVDPDRPGGIDMPQVPCAVHVAAGQVAGNAVAHPADQGVHGQTGRLAGDVPEAVVEVAEPPRLLVDPAGSLLEHLIEPLAVQGVFAHGHRPHQVDLVLVHGGGGHPAGDALIGAHLHEAFARLRRRRDDRLPLRVDAGPVLDAMQARHLHELRNTPRPAPLRQLLRDQLDVGDLHGFPPPPARFRRGCRTAYGKSYIAISGMSTMTPQAMRPPAPPIGWVKWSSG